MDHSLWQRSNNSDISSRPNVEVIKQKVCGFWFLLFFIKDAYFINMQTFIPKEGSFNKSS